MKAFSSLFLILYSAVTLSAPPIEGGKVVPKSNHEYDDIVELNLMYAGECTGTKVKDNLILTAAHCVTELKDKALSYKINAEDTLPSLGKIKKITIHPQYQQAVLDFYFNAKIERDIAEEKKALYDLAFIELKNKLPKKKEYPQIINSSTQFAKREKVEIAGFGAKNLYWDSEGWNFDFDEKVRLRSGNNEWISCPQNYFSDDLKKIQTLSQQVFASLQIQGTSLHIISDGQEVIQTSDKGMIMSGDSGSPAIERDIHGKKIITGVASTIKPIEEEMTFPTVEIISESGQVLLKKELTSMPKNWGTKEKTSESFVQVQELLEKNDLLDENGKPKKGIKINRKYTRTTTGNFSDLAHPHNQDFIKGVLDGTP